MKFRYILLGLLSALAFSCTVSEIDPADGPEGYSSPEPEVFYVSIDDQPGAETKVYADEQLRVLWNHDDRISIFNKTAYNREYSFQGNDGDNSGAIKAVGSAPSGTVPSLDPELVYAVYPYQESTSISTSGAISFDIPATQYYKENSFGLGANIMLSATDGNKLRFKNVGGYLALKMYGSNVKVSSIILRGNSEEVLAGPSTIQMAGDTTRVLIDGSASTASKEIRLYCETPVELGSSSSTDDCKVFWIVVPPVEFTNGFNVTIATPDGKTFTQSTSKPFTIRRSSVTRLSPFPVTPSGSFSASISKVTSTRPVAMSDGGSTNKTYESTYDSSTNTLSILLPTVTDLSNNVALSYVHTGDKILVNGKEVHNGEVLDATGQEATLMVCKGDAERRYTLKVTNTGLPVVRITTDGFTRESIESDTSHENWRGTGLKDENGITILTEGASIRIDMPDGSLGMIDNKGKPVEEVAMQIKGRGNASWKYPKRPYALKLDKKTAIRVMTQDGTEEVMPVHKRWILLANWKDITLLRNDAAFWLSRQTKERTGYDENGKKLGLPYTVRGQFVEVEFNGEHRGNYYLCEQIKPDENRVNIAKMADNETDPNNFGYIVEIDNNWDELNSFESSKFKFKYQFKEPDEEDRFPAAYDYMTGFISKFENSVYNLKTDTNSPYKDYLDIDSAIWFMLVNELTGNGDFYNAAGWFGNSAWYGPHSTYFYKDRNEVLADGTIKESKLHMGPIWDFDYLTFMPSRGNQWVGAKQKKYYYNFFFRDSEFTDRMKYLWNIYQDGLSSDFSTYVNSVANKIRTSEEIDYKMWWTKEGDQTQNGDYNDSFDQAVNHVIEGLNTKWKYMNSKKNGVSTLSYQNPGW